jgi:hypothetical protein
MGSLVLVRNGHEPDLAAYRLPDQFAREHPGQVGDQILATLHLHLKFIGCVPLDLRRSGRLCG